MIKFRECMLIHKIHKSEFLQELVPIQYSIHSMHTVQVLVHGEQNEMNRLKSALERELESEGVSSTQIYNPRNTQSVELHFKGEKVAKMVGKLVGEDLKSGQHVSGVLSKRGFKYHLMDSTEVSGVYFTHALIILPPTPSTSPPLS